MYSFDRRQMDKNNLYRLFDIYILSVLYGFHETKKTEEIVYYCYALLRNEVYIYEKCVTTAHQCIDFRLCSFRYQYYDLAFGFCLMSNLIDLLSLPLKF